MEQKKKEYEKPIIIKEEKYQTAGDDHCRQVKLNDCSWPAKA